jgi:hypothetical protein
VSFSRGGIIFEISSKGRLCLRKFASRDKRLCGLERRLCLGLTEPGARKEQRARSQEA